MGSFTAVSTGMLVGGDISVRAKEHLTKADIVFSLVPNGVADYWLSQLNSNVVSLQSLYAKHKHRMDSYEEMVELMMAQVRKGKRVCGAFYGHAGVFAWPPHETIRTAKKEGYHAEMLPGVSADAALYSDLGIDPCDSGIQAFEASQFLFYQHQINPISHVILWQIGLIGEHTGRSFDRPELGAQLLVEHLTQWYPLDHEVVLYECAMMAIESPRIETIKLKDIVDAELSLITTLLIKPFGDMKPNLSILKQLGIEEEDIAKRD
ncbi:MAG: hypothetical protein HWE16_09365 [Gammaproteobacteria bacterium]|nr:hypothetical protein [Gammaproteobacteria bacterium]